MSQYFYTTLYDLIARLNNPISPKLDVIPWSCPILSFGDMTHAKIATVGINPSNREFVDAQGIELAGKERRFHTLKSLGISNWNNISDIHLELIIDTCRNYFNRNPYNSWFKSLNNIISGTKASYYDSINTACHLDLIPYATARKWTELSPGQRSALIDLAGDTLALILKRSSIKLLVLNGKSVVNHLEEISGENFQKKEIENWALPRSSGKNVKGYSYKGSIKEICGIKFQHEIQVLGFNHNIQSSFGVTNNIKNSIRHWVTRNTKGIF